MRPRESGPTPRKRRVKPRTGGGPQGNGRITPPKAKPKPKPPTRTQIRQARAQARTYPSQGRAVEKAANEGRKSQRIKRRTEAIHGDHPRTDAQRKSDDAATRRALIKTVTSRGDKILDKKPSDEFLRYAASESSKPHSGTLAYTDYDARREEAALIRAKRLAPVLTVLDQTTRPLHGIAAGTNAALKGQSVPKAALRGLENKDKSTFSDVLKTAGVKNKTVRAAAGFVGDVGLDPTTYLTGGTAGVARSAAEKAAAGAEKKALAKGLTEEQAKRFGQRAAKQAAKPEGKGVSLKFAGHEVPGVTKATAKAAKPARAAGRKVTSEKARVRGRSMAADVNPNVAPAGVPKALSNEAIHATRTARGKINTGDRDAIALAHGIRTQIGEKNYTTVVDAIEARKIKDLPDHLRPHAITLRSNFKYIRRVQRRAGVKVADLANTKNGVKGYVYRQLTPEAVEADAKTAGKGGGTKPASSKARKEKRPLAVVRQESPGRYREDLHALAAERTAHGKSSAAKADLNRRLAEIGRDVKRGKPLALKDGEAVFHVKGSEIVEVTDKKAIERITRPLRPTKDGTKLKGANKQGGRYVVLNRDVVKRAKEGSAPTLQGPGIVHTFDKATSGFKRIAIATPGFHVRNFVGDTAQAYVRQPGSKLVPNLVRAKRVTRALAETDKAKRELRPVNHSGHTLKTKQYGDVPLEQAADMLVKHGAARSGYTARELNELSQSGGTKAGGALRGAKKRAGDTGAGQAAKRATLTREDLPRLATAIHALQNGATWEQAARSVADTHFDYAHLTNFERNVARRFLPFYTWSARNIPFTAKNVIARPGKYANYQKVREEAVKATSADQQDPKTRALYAQLKRAGVQLPKGWEKNLSEWEQRNAGVPVSWKGHKFTVSLGLPLQDLSEFPGAAGPGQASEYYQKTMSLVTPLIKDPVEFFDNHSFFFRDQIERDYSPNVAAPSYVSGFSDSLKKKIGVVKIIDKRSGKKVWAWPAKVDYLAKALPGSPNYAQQLATQGTDRRGKGTGGKVLAFAGVKSVPIDPATQAVNLAYARMHELQKTMAGLRQQGINAKNPTSEYTKLNAQLRLVTQIAYQGKAARGDKVLPTQGGPLKGRVRSSASTSSGTGGGFFKSHERPSTTSGTPGRGFFK